jgi:hypothetical protein
VNGLKFICKGSSIIFKQIKYNSNKYTIKNSIDLVVLIRLLKLKVEIDLDIIDLDKKRAITE